MAVKGGERQTFELSPPARNLRDVPTRTMMHRGSQAAEVAQVADRLYERMLVLRCQAGDEAAFAELVERYDARLRYYLHKLMGESPDDALQDVWLDVFRGMSRLTEPGALPAWLYRIARDRAFRIFRKRRILALPIEPEDVAESAEEEEFSSEDAERVHAALDRLPAEQREVVVLRFLEDMSYEDIARVTGSALGTVRSRLHYAKRALRRMIERNATDD
jgi:RNA polymerase sigma-70 factor (ECF subfamily)